LLPKKFRALAHELLPKKVKLFLYRHTNLRTAPTYPYKVEPIQLALLVCELERLRSVRGSVVEIGVFRGMTTRFLCEHFVREKINDTTYYAIDTFESFTDKDLAFETRVREKVRAELDVFDMNDFETWRKDFLQFPFVKPIRIDCSKVDYDQLAPKLVFLDVDLYLPTRRTIESVYNALVVGGTIIVDDVKNNETWDGAYQAYMEFCECMGFEPHIVGNKCGVIYKNCRLDRQQQKAWLAKPIMTHGLPKAQLQAED
jgi:O-methyltransferase